MKRRTIPVNATSDGCAYAVTASMPLRAGITNLLCGGGGITRAPGSWRNTKMRRTRRPINVTKDGNAFAIVTKYEARAYLKSMTGGGGYYPCTGVLETTEYDEQEIEGGVPQGG